MVGEANSGPKYSGLTVNERLFAAGLLEAFDYPVRAGNKEGMSETLIKVEMEPGGAALTTDTPWHIQLVSEECETIRSTKTGEKSPPMLRVSEQRYRGYSCPSDQLFTAIAFF